LITRLARWAVGFAALILMPTQAGAASPGLASPQAAAQAFYNIYEAQTRTGALPDATARMHYAVVLSPRLNSLLAQAQAAQVRFSARVRGLAPPMLGGDLFTSDVNGATGWSVGACTGDGTGARCSVALTFRKPGARPVQWHDTLVLAHTPGGWKVDDVVYDPGFAAGNTGSLSQMLKMMGAEAPPP
jgi:hypothetical protein